ncbi:unnamed protein product [Allacma fusca]|uniref:Uncharacterized protein n=1 Tax=Allacma fusca TaxID=39272 RepID=A0A8J2J212_9HEXA|nr:unnamed protein product [Allacma fusca]
MPGLRVYVCRPIIILLSAIAGAYYGRPNKLLSGCSGLEIDILATILVDNGLTVDYILAEYEWIPKGKNSMKEFLISKGYELIFDHKRDFLFKRRIINTI